MSLWQIHLVSLLTMSLAAADDSPLLSRLIDGLPDGLGAVATVPDHEVQVLYVQIEKTAEGPKFTQHGWHLDAERYFYPASTVKLPVALLALEKLAVLGVPKLDRDTTMLTDSKSPWQTERHEDPTSLTGVPSIAHDLRKIFLVSDNDAYNRLYEFVGLEMINERLREIGLTHTHIVHRLSVARGLDHGRVGNPIRFVNANGEVIHAQPESIAARTYYHGKKIHKGLGHMASGVLVEKPKEFTYNNAFPLEDQHRVLRSLFYPDGRALTMSASDREFAKTLKGQYPRETTETTDESIRNKSDIYVKNFLRWADVPIRDSLRCYNKSGQAYGYMVDNAYIVDRDHDVAFFLAAVIHVNANKIFNDDVYEYETIGEPFMKALGKAVYDYERSLKSTNSP